MSALAHHFSSLGSADLQWDDPDSSGIPNTDSIQQPEQPHFRALKRIPGEKDSGDVLDTALSEVTPPQTASRSLFFAPTRLPQTLLAEWSGSVLSVEEYFFTASLKGISGEGVRGEQEEDAEIPRSDVGKSDQELLRPGSYFRLCVFYELSDGDRPRRYTQVVFRRLPGYRKDELKAAAATAAEIHSGLRVG